MFIKFYYMFQMYISAINKYEYRFTKITKMGRGLSLQTGGVMLL